MHVGKEAHINHLISTIHQQSYDFNTIKSNWQEYWDTT